MTFWTELLKPDVLAALGSGAALVIGLIIVLRFTAAERVKTQQHQEKMQAAGAAAQQHMMEAVQTWTGNHMSHLYGMQDRQIDALDKVTGGLQEVEKQLAAQTEIVRDCATRRGRGPEG
jgi:hypothetical protein